MCLYMAPLNSSADLYIDERAPIPDPTETNVVLPMLHGKLIARTYDYRRQGANNLFAALGVQNEPVFGHCTRQHRSVEFHLSLIGSTGMSDEPRSPFHPRHFYQQQGQAV